MDNISWSGVAAVLGMFAVFLVVGRLAARKVKEGTATDLILAGRGLPLWLAIMTMTATWVDGGYLNGTTESVFRGNLAWAFQPGFCFGLSLIFGGLVFAHKMRRLEFTTLIDPFARRYGQRWAAVLFVPAMLGETFWSAALLVAIGSTFHITIGLPLTFAILLSAFVVTLYTMVGGMWSVAYTDAFQLLLIPIGLCAALPFALQAAGGLQHCFDTFAVVHPDGTSLFPTQDWSASDLVKWWDLSFMLVLGGIPWNCYFQRVLSCQSPEKARAHSIGAGLLTISLTVPPLLLGITAVALWHNRPEMNPTNTLPLLLREAVPWGIGLLGVGAILGAVTSSFSSSILSAGSMFSWNVYRPLAPETPLNRMKWIIRSSITLIGAGAVLLALRVQSVFDLWTFTADLIFVLLFPQLLWTLFDPQANRTGSITAFTASLFLRLGGGEPLFGIASFIDYPWFLPCKTTAAVTGLILMPLVSRLTANWDPPRSLEPPNGGSL